MFFNKIKSHVPEIILLGATGFLQFFRLGIGEIQSWDEALYVIRAEACVKFGAWLDQTQYAVGGIYSSTHPPLIIWMMAAARMIFGTGMIATRIISPLAAIMALIFFYKLAGRFFTRWTRLFATVSLGCSQLYLWYGHHAQLDIPMLAFVMCCAYFAVRAIDEDDWKLVILAGILFGCVLMSKAFQGLYLLPFLIALPYIFRSKHRYRNLTILFSLSIFVALPWYIYMAIVHREFYSDYSALLQSMKAGTYAKAITIKWWYYLNQTIINIPLLILGVVSIKQIAKQWKHRESMFDRLSLVSFLWFAGSLLLLSSFGTKMPHFFLFLLLPTLLLACFFIEHFLQSSGKKFKVLISSVIVFLALGWSASELIRKSIREHHFPSLDHGYEAIIAAITLSIIIAIVLYKRFSLSPQIILIFVTSLLLISADYYRWGSRDNETYIDGVEQIGNVLLHSSEIHSISVYHDDYPHELYMPQLNYYTDGWLLGWDKNRTGETKTWYEVDSLLKAVRVPKSDAAIVYVPWDGFYIPKQEETALLMRINQGLSAQYARVLHRKKYQLYWEPRKE